MEKVKNNQKFAFCFNASVFFFFFFFFFVFWFYLFNLIKVGKHFRTRESDRFGRGMAVDDLWGKPSDWISDIEYRWAWVGGQLTGFAELFLFFFY